MRRRWWLLPVLLLVAGGCTSGPAPDPVPSPTAPVATSPVAGEPVGVRVAVVLPPPDEAPLTTAGSEAGVEAVAEAHGDDLGELRTVAADAAAYVGDLVTLLAERGYDLVCAVGDVAAEVVVGVSTQFPATRFCAVSGPTGTATPEPPDNVLLLTLRTREAAYLAGVAAAQVLASPATPPDATPGAAVPGFVTDGRRVGAEAQQTAYTSGVAAGLGRPVTPRVATDARTEEDAAEIADEQFAEGVPVIFTSAGVADAGVLDAAARRDGLVILLRDRSGFGEEGPAPEVLTWFRLDVGVALDLAVTRVLEGWEGGVADVGLAEDAIVVEAGAASRGQAVTRRVATAADDLREGRTTVSGG